jgi:hypothetical protein
MGKAMNAESSYIGLLKMAHNKIASHAGKIAELEKSLKYAEDFNSAALENLMRSGAIAIIEAVWEDDMLCPKIIMLNHEQSDSIRNYLHV